MGGDDADTSSSDDAARSGSTHAATGSGRALERVCGEVVSAAGVDGAGITVMGSLAGGLEGARDQVAATDEVSRRLEELQLTVGEGPCLDAFATGGSVLVADLASGFTRWLAFAPEAHAAGAAAVFSLPLQVGAVRLGTLDLYRSRPGDLTREQLAAALAVAETATELLLENSGPDADPDEDVGWLSGVHADVHIASGVVSVQAGVDVGAALLRLRAHAFAHGEPLHEVARRIVDHTLVLGDAEDDPGRPTDGAQATRTEEDDDR